MSPAERIEEAARNRTSEAYHDHPSNPSSCATFVEMYGKPCPCENNWRLNLTEHERNVLARVAS